LTLHSTENLFEACTILFGSEVTVSLDFLRYLQPSGIKAAYRKRAMETHPDLARALGQDEVQMNERFKEVALAYERLIKAIKGNGAINFNPQNRPEPFSERPKPKPKPANPRTDHSYNGDVPKRKLLFAQFLYYSGLISWQTLIEAIAWQRTQRPRIGQIAQDWGILTPDDIHQIILHRDMGEKFGESAIRQGKLTPFNVKTLLGRQRFLQKRIGEFFIQKGLFTPKEMESMVKRQWLHNWDALRY
jgi:hypothetical protein